MRELKMITGALALAGATCVYGKTVALWPFEYDAALNAVDLRCAVSAASDLYATGDLTVTNQTVGWYLPPNPDTTEDLLFTPGNRYALARSGTTIFRSTAATLAQQMDLCRDFTLEGWISPTQIDNGQWYVIANINGGSAYVGGVIWSIRRTRVNADDATKKDITFEVFANGTDHILTKRLTTDEEKAALTNGWHHFALVFTYAASDTKSTFEMFYDGVSCGSALVDRFAAHTVSAPMLELGGRSTGGTQSLVGSWDYWRLSDAALTTEAFLYASSGGTPEPAAITPSTVAYWPLCVGADGSLDARDYAGGADLNLGLLEQAANIDRGVTPSTDAAFTGNPPNTTVTLPDGNDGSMAMRNWRAKIDFAGLGDHLDITNSFTVEGWFKPEGRDAVMTDYQAISSSSYYHYLFNTRTSGNGWVLQYEHSMEMPGVCKFALYAWDPGYNDGKGGWMLSDVGFGTFGPDDPDWMHVALVYDHTAGNGTWSLYINGELQHSSENKWKPQNGSNGHDFMLGGRISNYEIAFGALDCVRVAKAALSPNQFLNATSNPQAATDVLALWPLNAKANGLVLDLTNVVSAVWSGSTGTKYADAKYVPTTDAATPTIANPDTSGAVREEMPAGGSASFNQMKYLMTSDKRILDTVNGKNDYTWECYMKQPALLASGWAVLMYVANTLGVGSGTCSVNFTWRPAGFVLLDSAHRPSGRWDDVTMDGTKDALGTATWHHVALTFDRDGSTDGKPRYTLYLDGVAKSSLDCTTDAVLSPVSVMFFGRYWSYNSFAGQVSSMRLSNRLLAPAEFLCGNQPLPTPATPAYRTGTIAYWPLEEADSGAETLDRVGAYAASTNATQALVSGIPDAAVRRVPRPDAQTGVGKTNNGAVSLSSGALTASSLGLQLEYDRAFTVEGWWKRDMDMEVTPKTLFGTYSPRTDAGWKVYVNVDTSSGTTKLQLKVLAKYPDNWTPVADGILIDDVAALAGKWSHLAVVYDPTLGTCGRWTAYVDGTVVGHLDNAWRNSRWHCALQRFGFGAATTTYESGFLGDLDQWRVSGAALTADQFLYAPPKGFWIICR